VTRTASISHGTTSPKTQRSSKTSQKLVVLPSAPQTKPLLDGVNEDLAHGYETDTGLKEYKSEAEKMSKEQRKLVSGVSDFARSRWSCFAPITKTKVTF